MTQNKINKLELTWIGKDEEPLAVELRDFCMQPTGITFEGRGNTKIYVKR